jgi:hypothetical protein
MFFGYANGVAPKLMRRFPKGLNDMANLDSPAAVKREGAVRQSHKMVQHESEGLRSCDTRQPASEPALFQFCIALILHRGGRLPTARR